MSTLDLFSVPPSETADLLPRQFRDWFASRGWSPREHQLALLAKAREERSALLIAPTGAGKTLAGFLPTLVELSGEASATTLHAQTRSPPPPLRERGMPLVPNDTAYPSPQPSPARREGALPASAAEPRRSLVSTGRGVRRSGGLHTLYISPLKALAVD
ncbi:MAG: DEAD/DEAH box helicase, partial [Bradyrhizobium sp.]